MSAYRAALLALFVVGAALVTAVPASATPLHGVDADRASTPGDALAQQGTDERVRATGPQMAAQNASQNNSSLGADISSFMQSSAAEVGGAVETGMWTAAYNSTDNETVRVRLVQRQTTDLRDELTDLRERKAELLTERNTTNVSDAAYKAKLGQLLGRINALQAAINATEVRARETNTNVAAVAELQTETENLTGPEIAAVARNVTGVGVGNGERGPPSDVSNANGNESGNGDANGNGNGNGDANGNGNGNGDANGNGNANGNADGVADEENATTTPANGTSNASQRGPPAPANAPMADNSSSSDEAATMPNASTPTRSPVSVADATTVGYSGDSTDYSEDSTGYSGDSTGTAVFPAVGGAADDFVGPISDAVAPVSDALAVRTYAFSHAPGSL